MQGGTLRIIQNVIKQNSKYIMTITKNKSNTTAIYGKRITHLMINISYDVVQNDRFSKSAKVFSFRVSIYKYHVWGQKYRKTQNT